MMETEENMKTDDSDTKDLQPTSTTKVPVLAEKSGELIGATLEDQYRIANAYYKSGMLPKHYNSPEKVLTGIQFARELSLKPLTALRQIAIINGTPTAFGELPLAMVRRSGLLEWIDEFGIDKEGNRISVTDIDPQVFGAVCRLKRKGDPEPVVRKFTLADAQRAGLTGRDTYRYYPARMTQMRARSQALKDAFPDVLAGVAIAEYDFHMGERDITPDREFKTEAEELNEALGEL